LFSVRFSVASIESRSGFLLIVDRAPSGETIAFSFFVQIRSATSSSSWCSFAGLPSFSPEAGWFLKLLDNLVEPDDDFLASRRIGPQQVSSIMWPFFPPPGWLNVRSVLPGVVALASRKHGENACFSGNRLLRAMTPTLSRCLSLRKQLDEHRVTDVVQDDRDATSRPPPFVISSNSFKLLDKFVEPDDDFLASPRIRPQQIGTGREGPPR
jgi:hypothetical protein